MDKDSMAWFLLNIVRQVAIIPTEDLGAHISASRQSLSMHHAIGWAIDPTAYNRAMYNGTHDSAELQNEMAEHLLAIRKLIDKHESLREKYLPGEFDDAPKTE